MTDFKKQIGKQIIHHHEEPVAFRGGSWTYATEDRVVVLLAISGIWAMVRRPKCAPYVVHVKQLKVGTVAER